MTLFPVVQNALDSPLWSRYDSEADVLCIHFWKPNVATDSDFADNDVIVRYYGNEVIGITILHASQP